MMMVIQVLNSPTECLFFVLLFICFIFIVEFF